MEIQEGLLPATGQNQASSLVNRVSARALAGLKSRRQLMGWVMGCDQLSLRVHVKKSVSDFFPNHQ